MALQDDILRLAELDQQVVQALWQIGCKSGADRCGCSLSR